MHMKTLTFLFFIISTSCLLGQRVQLLYEINGTKPVYVATPMKTDSVNIKGEEFTEKSLLKMHLSIPEHSEFKSSHKTDGDNLFRLQKPLEGSSLQLLSFYLSSDRYGKAILKITSPNMLEVYVDGILKKSKTTKEDSLIEDKALKIDVSPYPASNRIVIKLMASAGDTQSPVMKVEIEKDRNDTIANFITSSSPLRRMSFEDNMLGNRVSNVSISPQGQYALISYRNTMGERSAVSTELYNIRSRTRVVIDTNSGKRQLSWLPSSEKLYYVSKTGDKSNLVTINPATLEETTIARDIPDEHIMFSPDEKTLFYSKQENGDERKGDLKLLKSMADRQTGYLTRSAVFKYDLATGLSQQLTFGSLSIYLNDISPDSRKLLVSYSEEELTQRPFRKNTMLLLDIETMVADTLWYRDGFAGGASFSPDGRKIVATGSAEAFGGIGTNVGEGQTANSYNTLAFVIDLETKSIAPITKNFDPSISNCWWNRNDNMIYMLVSDKDYEAVYTYNHANGRFSKLPLQEDVVRSFRIAGNASVGVYSGVSVSNSTRAYVYDTKSQKSTLIADPYSERLAQLNLGKVSDWNFVNSDGIEIEGRYYLPPNFDASKKYPLIVYYYGGTTTSPRTFESSYPAHVFAAQDYVVYVLQPSGTTGYGQKFAAMHVNAWGKRTAEDIIEGTTKFVSNHTFVDGSKIGCIGASYGGFMTMYLQTRTNMFAAAVSHAGISSITSYWGEGYWGYGYSSAASANNYPWNNHGLYVGQSPIYSADKINTPILLTHGAVDTNVPIGESIQMYTALKILGKPVEFIQVKDENHGITNYNRRIEWNNSIMAWFAKWLKDDARWWESLYD